MVKVFPHTHVAPFAELTLLSAFVFFLERQLALSVADTLLVSETGDMSSHLYIYFRVYPQQFLNLESGESCHKDTHKSFLNSARSRVHLPAFNVVLAAFCSTRNLWLIDVVFERDLFALFAALPMSPVRCILYPVSPLSCRTQRPADVLNRLFVYPYPQ